MEYFEMNLGYAIWAKNYLRFGFKHLISHMKDTDIVSPECPVKRRVPRCYYMLADSLMGIVQKKSKIFRVEGFGCRIIRGWSFNAPSYAGFGRHFFS